MWGWTGKNTASTAIVPIVWRVNRTTCDTFLCGWVLVIVRWSPRATRDTSFCSRITVCRLTLWAFSHTLSGEVISEDIGRRAVLFSDTEPINRVSKLSCFSTSLLASISIVSITKISVRANRNTCSGCGIWKVIACAWCLTFVAVQRVGKIRRGAMIDTCTIVVGIRSMWACTDTFICDIINKIVCKASRNTSPIVRYILNIVSIRTNIYTHFHIRICVWKHLTTRSSWAILNTLSINRITILITWAVSSLHAMIYISSFINKSTIRTSSHTFSFNISEAIVRKIVRGARIYTLSGSIEGIWSWCTELQTNSVRSTKRFISGGIWRALKCALSVNIIVVGLFTCIACMPRTS